MPRGTDLDHLAIHRALWERADRLGRVRLNQTEFADELGVTKFTMSRVIAAFIEDDRLELVTRNKNNRGQFKVMDPDQWLLLHGDWG